MGCQRPLMAEEPEDAAAQSAEQPGGLTKLVVNLVPDAYASLHAAATLTDATPTDTVNQALQLYAYVEEQKAAGWQLALVKVADVKLVDVR